MNRLSAAGLGVISVGVGWILAQAGCAGVLRVPPLGPDFGTVPAPVPNRGKPAEAPLVPEEAPAPPPAPTPAWVEVVKLDTATGFGFTPWACDGKIDIQPPIPGGGAPDAPDVAPGFAPAATDEVDLWDLSKMTPWEMGGANAGLPPEVRSRLLLDAPFDLAAIPLEPLRGPETAKAKLRAFYARAAAPTPGEPLRAAVWGASHVAGEFFTGHVRRILQDRWGDGGHGLLQPASPWTGYRRTDVNICATGTWVTDFVARKGGRGDGSLAPTGTRVEANMAASAAWAQTTTSNPHGQKANRVRVLASPRADAGTLDVIIDSAPPIPFATGRVLEVAGAAGDPPGGVAGATAPAPSSTVPVRALDVRVPDTGHRVELRPRGDGTVALLGMALERDQGFVLDGMGVTGRTASSWLAWDEDVLRATLAWRPPGLVVLAYGTNEANDANMGSERYRATLGAVLAKVRRVAPDAACILVGPSDRGKALRKGKGHVIWGPTAMIARVQAEVAPQYDCLSWDLQAVTGGPGSMFRWFEAGLSAGDLIHFTQGGYQEVARRFVAAMDEAVAPAPSAVPPTEGSGERTAP